MSTHKQNDLLGTTLLVFGVALMVFTGWVMMHTSNDEATTIMFLMG